MRPILAAFLILSFAPAAAVPLEGLFSPFDSGRDPVGVRALGLGGAFAGVADDLTAVVWNPAGLAQLDGIRIQVEGGIFSAKSAEGDLHRLDQAWDASYTVLVPPVRRGGVLAGDFTGAGAAWNAGPVSLFSAMAWVRTRQGNRDDVTIDPVSGITDRVVQRGGVYHLTAAHAAGWRGRWFAGFAVHGMHFGALEGTFLDERQEAVPYAKIFRGRPAYDAGLLARPLDGWLAGLRLGAVYHGPTRLTFNYSDTLVWDFDHEALVPPRVVVGASWLVDRWRACWQWETSYESRLNGVEKRTYGGNIPSTAFPIRYFDVRNWAAGLEVKLDFPLWKAAEQFLSLGVATLRRGYALESSLFAVPDAAVIASFGEPKGSMLTWGLRFGAPRWFVHTSCQSRTMQYEYRSKDFEWRWGGGARF